MKTRTPPEHLSNEAGAFFTDVATEFSLWGDTAALKLLEAAAVAWQRMVESRERIKADGLVVTDRFDQLKPHPCVAIERDSRVGFCRALRELHLEPMEDADLNRPPAIAKRDRRSA